MPGHWCFVPLLCYGFIVQTEGLIRSRQIFPQYTDPNLFIEDEIKQNGYPYELHHVTTRDGYILAMHRIPSYQTSNNSYNTENRRVVLLMHGLLGCSMDWVITGRNRSLAYLLSDNGYDVWLGNSRGTTNSKNHTRLSLESREYWDFSWHEMGMYDLPAMIDYTLKETGQKQIFYIGFSQGTTQFWILMSLRPEYNRKIKLMSALAPVAYTGHIGGALRPLSFIGNLFRRVYKYTGFFELLSNSDVEKMIAYRFCRRGLITVPICAFLVSSIGGFSHGETDFAHLGEYLQFAPAGCSLKQLIHYAMGIQNPGHFRPYDNGLIGNILKYRRFVPPEYPVGRITAPVILYNGLSDVLSHPKDVEILQRKLPNCLEKHTITTKPLSHFDFMFGLSAPELVYEYVIDKMNSIA